MPNFKVELYGDVGFTADGSNILDFLTREARDAYFDNLPHTTRTGTSVNKDFLDTGSIKLEVSDADTVKYANASYMRVTSERFVQSTAEPSHEVTYLFIASYEVVSSAENTTVIRYTVVNDNWMNYQFDIKLRPCSVERMHVDRWSADSKDIVRTPCMDLLEGYYQSSSDTPIRNLTEEQSVDDMSLMCVVYTTGYSEKNAEPYKIICMPVYNNNLEAVKGKTRVGGSPQSYFSLKDALDGTLANDIGIAPSSIISVYVQPLSSYRIFEWLTLEGETPTYGISFKGALYPSTLSGRVAYEYPLETEFTSPGYSIILDSPSTPSDGAMSDMKYEPAMYRSPVRQYKIRYGYVQFPLPQNLCDALRRDDIKLFTYSPISLDGSGSILYFGDNLSKALANGWAFELPTLDGNIINDQWLEYLYTSRGADRAMMWTNIATLGLSDLGSTYVSGSIGYRSNMTQAQARNLEMQTQLEQKNYYDMRSKLSEARFADLNIRELTSKENLATTMAKQSMMASGIGGIAAAGANAIGSYSAQENRESAIKNQPAIVSNGGNVMGLFEGNMLGASVVESKVEPTIENRYFELFSKFGYYVGAVTQPNLRTRKFFNYLKTNGAIVTGNAPQTVLLNIASMFDAGTTIWHMDKCTKDTLYDYTYENIERSLI